jgi:hypothetical protein
MMTFFSRAYLLRVIMASLVPVEQRGHHGFLMACECAFLSAVDSHFLSSVRANQLD